MTHFSSSGFSLLITAWPGIFLRACEQFSELTGYVWRICLHFILRKSIAEGLVSEKKVYESFCLLTVHEHNFSPREVLTLNVGAHVKTQV